MARTGVKTPPPTDGLTAGGAIFSRLKTLGVDVVFANAGTDFPPIIEGLADARAKGIDLPQAIPIPHEHAAMGMAHGYYLMTGRAQAVMLHTNVGLANGSIGAINAACEHIPMILMSGRTPVTEEKRFGARTVPISWGQEMRDQGALVREACKWEYELRFPEQITGLLDRGHAIANSTPKGPVYLSLPREVLCEGIDEARLDDPVGMQPATLAGNPADIARAAEMLANAKNPLVIVQRGTGDAATFDAFARFVREWGLPVCSWWSTHLGISTEHPCHIGGNPGDWLKTADVVLVVNALAPWWPDEHEPNPDARVIHLGPDPLFARFPVRNFRSDISIAGETALALPMLIEAMKAHKRNYWRIGERLERIRVDAEGARHGGRWQAASKNAIGISRLWASKCIGEALRGRKSSVFTELGTVLGVMERTEHKSFFQEPHSGGLGWSVPAALGAKLAEPDRLCVATCGDGSYMFANPTACHQIAEALDLPILIIVLNNAEWGAVRMSVEDLYPEGKAHRSNQMPLTSLSPSPDFTLTARASRAWAREVTEAQDLPAALAAAIEATEQGRQALLNVKMLS
jgi:acetolactate synthase-1/2/3 large subunit